MGRVRPGVIQFYSPQLSGKVARTARQNRRHSSNWAELTAGSSVAGPRREFRKSPEEKGVCSNDTDAACLTRGRVVER